MAGRFTRQGLFPIPVLLLLLLLLPLLCATTTIIIPSMHGGLKSFNIKHAKGDGEHRPATPKGGAPFTPRTPRSARGLPGDPTASLDEGEGVSGEMLHASESVPLAQEYGFRFPRVAAYKTITKFMDSPADKACVVGSDCTKKCVESCQMALMDIKCATRNCRNECRMKNCSADIGTIGRSTENCQYECDTTCIMDCRLSEENKMFEKLTSCVQKKKEECMHECHGQRVHSVDTCRRECDTKARADCTATASRECLRSCGGHVCSREGRCKCPFISKGDSMCKNHTWLRGIVPHSSKFCFQSPFESKFRESKYGEWHTPRIPNSFLHDPARSRLATHEANKWYAANHHSKERISLHPAPDLPDLGDFSTCAVIGSSGVLTGSGLGKEIDNHTAVIRFNDAPTRGYEADVGAKTTLRIQNNMYCGFCERHHEVLFPYTISTVEKFCAPREGHPTCPIFRSSLELRSFVTRFYEPLIRKFAHNDSWYMGEGALSAEGKDESGWAFDMNDDYSDDDVQRHRLRRHLLLNKNTTTQVINGEQVPLKDISAGMTGIVLAMHMCHEVDVYGFGKAETYYYPKVKRADRDWGMLHYWPLEHHCMDTYSKYVARVNFHA